jgi:hypothetical protein
MCKQLLTRRSFKMNMKKIALALAVTAGASVANANMYLATDDAGNTGGSSFFFAAYDAAATTTLYVNLNDVGTTGGSVNARVHTFDEFATDQGGNYTWDLASVAAANNFSMSNVQWTIVAGETVTVGAGCTLSTLEACGQTWMSTVSNGEIVPTTLSQFAVQSEISAINNDWFLTNRGNMDANGGAATMADGNFGQWVQGADNANALYNSTGMTGETLAFAAFESAGVPNSRNTGVVPDSTSYSRIMPGTWTLSETSLTYSAVPVPAAVWMFASGLIGLAGVARRRQQKA